MVTRNCHDQAPPLDQEATPLLEAGQLQLGVEHVLLRGAAHRVAGPRDLDELVQKLKVLLDDREARVDRVKVEVGLGHLGCDAASNGLVGPPGRRSFLPGDLLPESPLAWKGDVLREPDVDLAEVTLTQALEGSPVPFE